ncbi:glycosyltransferase [Flavobacterium kingsejongi]|uniref:glycosyltransferase n=1 Tax=Flavobacterium kingsejongi TaxID=1678728 RepID=UPI000D52BF56
MGLNSTGFSYSIYEALQLLTPVIVTDFPSAHEQVIHEQTGYILDFNLSNLNVETLYKKIPVIEFFNELSNENDWVRIITNN